MQAALAVGTGDDVVRIRELHEDSRGVLGAPRMRDNLADEGIEQTEGASSGCAS
jgi:hypothetical protein